jgi:hypothetical protein
VVDYAGTFPPARLDMTSALKLYGSYLSSPHSWMLDKLILPLASLRGSSDLFPELSVRNVPSAWSLSVIVPAEDLDTFHPPELEAFHRQRICIVSIEVSACDPEAIRKPPHVRRETFFEVPLVPGAGARLDAIARAGCGAKVRTGGLEPRAFPSAGELASFLFACSERQIPFKATAGLHHPFRSARKLGKEAGGAEVVMHGFVNLAVTACLLNAGVIGMREAIEVLEERDPREFVFEEHAVEWRGRRVGVREIEEARRSFFRSFGACSFEEPLEGLSEAGVLP